MISLIQLEYLVALDKYKSFSAAAEHCFVTQPTLSMQIKKMENDLEVTLFDRAKKPVTPTDIGAIIVQQAKNILAETAKIEELVQINKDTLSGTLRIGIIPSIAPYLLPSFIGKFAKKHTGIDIHVKELLSEDIMDAIESDRIDVGILATPLPREGFNVIPLFYEKILLYCSKDHDFADYDSIGIQQMQDKKIWLMSNGNCFRNQAINLCDLRQSSDQTSFHYESASIETLIKLVDTEGGLTLLPEMAVDGLTPKKTLLVKPFKNLNPVREVSLISNRIFVKKRMIEALELEIKKSINSEMLEKNRGEIVEWT
ncbi:hydrogen peroxide-inducible genes activator [Crocinitomix sp.]|nr:hydrogen peroxide-inducible genes activator [Crocinitomix sp.]